MPVIKQSSESYAVEWKIMLLRLKGLMNQKTFFVLSRLIFKGENSTKLALLKKSFLAFEHLLSMMTDITKLHTLVLVLITLTFI